MKTHATFRYLLTFVSLAALLAIRPSDSRAEDKQAFGKDPIFAEYAANGYDFVIAGGSLWLVSERRKEPANLGAIVDALRKRYAAANIVLAPGLSDLELPDLKLRASTLTEMLEAIRIASGNRFDWIGPVSPGLNLPAPKPQPEVDPKTGLPVAVAMPDPDTGLFVLREPMRTGQNERVVEAFNIARYLELKTFEARSHVSTDGNNKVGREEIRAIEEETINQLESLIVETVASYMQTGEGEVRQNLKFQYHRGATLLIVTGPREEVEVARKVMSALITDPSGGKIPDGWEGAAAKEEPVSIEAIPVKSANLTMAYSAAMSLLNDKRSKVVVMDERTKTLIVSATKAEVSAIKKAVEQLDLAAKPYVGDNPSPTRAAQGR